MESSDSSGEGDSFSGYQWNLFSLQHGALRSRTEKFLASVNWPGLLKYAAKKRNLNVTDCILLPDIGLGYNHMVRIIEFTDKARWIARVRMPRLGESTYDKAIVEKRMSCELNAISLVRQKSGLPTPEVHAFDITDESIVKAPFMLMDCLEGNVGMDLGMEVPQEYMQTFLNGMAKLHVELSAVQLPKIGTILSINDDGTYEQGPIPGIGGPFDTATEFYKAWASNIKFRMSEEELRAASGPYAAEVIQAVSSFPNAIGKIASKLSVRDNGPFPLCHGDFGHNNIIVDDKYRIVGLIDWEMAFAGPWEIFGDFPLCLSVTPPAMDAPFNYDENGLPKDPALIQKFTDQAEYVAAVKVAESQNNHDHEYSLSEALNDSKRQQIATAMRLYGNGKVGIYSKLINEFL
ncbi:50f95ff2-3d3f-49b6-ad12-429a0b3eace0 [Sclerotinia trifoliorum]|uniref:50f95ff2-3d3f-49b6-ad12-429a0b3eace0 n=1 Tax=Sclerotinia trifoliorum TaxID=28548 RepID=A0A8H2VY91_9HELO|nr:50f95ff2-3d3f-49b6-ad12-429a0b3eace0 [Sclerotinia trifoliorum]